MRHAACIRGTNARVGFILGELAKGLTVEDVVALYEGGRSPSAEGVHAALAYGGVLAREETLPAPAAAGFAETLPAGVSLHDVRAHAGTVLGELAAGASREELLEGHRAVCEELIAAVLRYAASLAYMDQPMVSVLPHATFLRDMLTEPDRTLVEDFMLYWWQTNGPGPPDHNYPVGTPDSCLFFWQRLVEQVERDDGYAYNDLLGEYANELGRRDGLEEWLTVVSPSNKERWYELIMALDKRFERATTHTRQPLWVPKSEWAKPVRWWWYRLPKRLRRQGFDGC
jgi:uncharacterized protein (DUF433 family)